MDEDMDQFRNQSGEAIAATQQVGDDLPSGIRLGKRAGTSMDDPSTTGDINPDSPDPTNTAAGVSVGGTGAGIEPAVDADLLLHEASEPEQRVADIYDEPGADLDFDRTSG